MKKLAQLEAGLWAYYICTLVIVQSRKQSRKEQAFNFQQVGSLRKHSDYWL